MNSITSFTNRLQREALADEVWLPILGFRGRYEVSNFGRVRGLTAILKPSINNCGYLNVGLCLDRIRKTKKVHRLVAAAFLPNPENKPQVNHKDGDKSNNKASNLEWATKSENELHAYSTGLKIKLRPGDRPENIKLCPEKVLEIRSLLSNGAKGVELAKKYNVTPMLISLIKNRQIWTHFYPNLKRKQNEALLFTTPSICLFCYWV